MDFYSDDAMTHGLSDPLGFENLSVIGSLKKRIVENNQKCLHNHVYIIWCDVSCHRPINQLFNKLRQKSAGSLVGEKTSRLWRGNFL